jgi:hypothetical protein
MINKEEKKDEKKNLFLIDSLFRLCCCNFENDGHSFV